MHSWHRSSEIPVNTFLVRYFGGQRDLASNREVVAPRRSSHPCRSTRQPRTHVEMVDADAWQKSKPVVLGPSRTSATSCESMGVKKPEVMQGTPHRAVIDEVEVANRHRVPPFPPEPSKEGRALRAVCDVQPLGRRQQVDGVERHGCPPEREFHPELRCAGRGELKLVQTGPWHACEHSHSEVVRAWAFHAMGQLLGDSLR